MYDLIPKYHYHRNAFTGHTLVTLKVSSGKIIIGIPNLLKPVRNLNSRSLRTRQRTLQMFAFICGKIYQLKIVYVMVKG